MLESTQTKLIDTLERIARAIEGSDAKRAEAWKKLEKFVPKAHFFDCDEVQLGGAKCNCGHNKAMELIKAARALDKGDA